MPVIYQVDMRDNSITQMELSAAIRLIYPDWRVEHYTGVDRVWTGCFGLGRRRFTCRSRSEFAAKPKVDTFIEDFLLDWRPTFSMPYVFFSRKKGAERFVELIEAWRCSLTQNS